MSFEFNSLDEVADVVDSLHKTPTYSETGYPMVRGTDVKYGTLDLSSTFKVAETVFLDFSRKYKPSPKDIIITRVGTYGVTAQVKEINFCLGQNIAAIIPSQINADYLFYVLNSPYLKSQIESGVVGSTQKTLSLKVIKSFKIPRFDKSSEAEIASILSALDNRISLLRETNTTLEAIAQTLFKSWFVDFDPVKAKAEGRLPEGMDEATAELFPSEFEESALGLIPKGWRVGMLGNELKITYGKNLPTNKLLNYGFPVFGGNGQIGFFDKYIYEERQILISCRGAASGKVNQSLPKSFITNNSLVLETGKGKLMRFGYLKWLMKNSDLSVFVTGSAQPQVTIDNIKGFKMLLPDVPILDLYESISGDLEDRIEENEKQSQTLTTLRDTLLPRLISGQLRLNQAQEIMDEVGA